MLLSRAKNQSRLPSRFEAASAGGSVVGVAFEGGEPGHGGGPSVSMAPLQASAVPGTWALLIGPSRLARRDVRAARKGFQSRNFRKLKTAIAWFFCVY
ncbi:hypothetical protein ACS0X5_18365 [Burkholderia gladioli]|uniref:hypothetical protein n=1 Tax=Burkholderia gladioli TaxID=28095 RepID=UPI0012F832A0|nr:hypothetical protein [Burkholderia gladioli]